MERELTIEPLGKLEPVPQIPDWLRSRPVEIPYLDGLALPFVLRVQADDPSPGDFQEAVTAFLNLGPVDREEAAQYVFLLYRRTAEDLTDEELGFSVESPSEIWRFVTPTEVHVCRRSRRDRAVYVEILAECEWEEEHGLAIVYRRGSTLSRVSSQDGHLTTTDAFDLSEDEDCILYEG